MNSLRELQESCYKAFVLGEPDALLPAVRTNDVAAEHRIQVYQNNARETFRKALLASFPVVERLVAEACFSGLALKYMREHPSRSGDLQKFGATFPDFLAEIYATTRFAYLADVAHLEWALEEVHLEPDEGVLDATELSSVPPEDHPTLVFRVRKALRLLRSPYPILSIWRANQPDNDASVDLDQGGECVAVLRRGDDLQMHLLDADAFTLASGFADGGSLQEACDSLADGFEADNDDTVPDLATALQSVIGLGLLTSFSVATPPGPTL